MLDQMKKIDFQNLNYPAKKQIIKGLEEQKDKHACWAIAEFLYDENKSIQEFAMDALNRIGNQEVIEALLPMLQDREARIRNMAMEIIREIAYDKIYLLTPLLNSSNEPIRIYIADLLGLIGNPEAVPYLIQCLQDGSANVRSSAIASLGRLGNEQAINAIERLLVTEKELWVIFSAIKGLEHIGGTKATQILANMLKQGDEFILAAAIESLGEIGKKDTIGVILKNIDYGSENIVERVNTAIMAIINREQSFSLNEETKAAVTHFFTYCAKSNLNPWTRFRSIEFLGKLRAKESLNTLSEITQSTLPMLKIAAAKALGSIGGEEAKALLRQLLTSNDQNIQNVAQECLTRIS